MDWQPIETAPKDFSFILIYIPGARREVREVRWAIPYEAAVDGFWMTDTAAGPGRIFLPEAPTHWMPLPKPPATTPGGEEVGR